MRLIVSFSARRDGNCGQIARYLAGEGDRIVHYAGLNAHACAGCDYECMQRACRYREDGVHELYQAMAQAERAVLIVPMYGGNPCAQYFAFCERGQDYFRSEEAYEAFVQRLYIIGVYGSARENPDFVPCLQKWFAGTGLKGRVLPLERHVYGQRLTDSLLDVADVRDQLDHFMT